MALAPCAKLRRGPLGWAAAMPLTGSAYVQPDGAVAKPGLVADLLVVGSDAVTYSCHIGRASLVLFAFILRRICEYWNANHQIEAHHSADERL